MNKSKRWVFKAMGGSTSRRGEHKALTEMEIRTKKVYRKFRSNQEKDPTIVKVPNHRDLGKRTSLPTYKVRKGDLVTLVDKKPNWNEWTDYECVSTNPVEWKETYYGE